MVKTFRSKLFLGYGASSQLKIPTIESKKTSRILVVSMRGCGLEAFRSAEYEFEDTIGTFDDIDILAPRPAIGLPNFVNKKISNYLAASRGKSNIFNSGCRQTLVEKEYDLIFFICQHYWDITYINSIKGWRKKCNKAVLWLSEIWTKELEENKIRLCLQISKDFDYIFTPHSSSVDAITKLVNRPCDFLPFAVDTTRFCPYPQPPQRNIDIYSIGRRSQVVHKALLDLAEQKNLFYLYDTFKGLKMIDYKEHRTLYSNLIKRSRYFIVNKPKFDSLEQTGGQEELGSRFFEGAAGGAVMIGTPPVCEAYNKNFNWCDAVIEISHDADNLAELITELDAQPERLNNIRRDNIVNSLLRHDWVYRWEQVLHKVGLDNTPEMLSRQAYLKNLAEMVSTV